MRVGLVLCAQRVDRSERRVVARCELEAPRLRRVEWRRRVRNRVERHLAKGTRAHGSADWATRAV